MENQANSRIPLGKWAADEPDDPDGIRTISAKKGEGFFLDREHCKSGHMHIRGRTGAGKTSRALMPLVMELVKPYQLSWATSKREKKTVTESDCLMVFDLGGDRALFNLARTVAKQKKRKFRYLTLDSKRSHRFDPMQCVPDEDNRIISITNLLLRAFSLDNGLIYGGAYYTSRNMQLLLGVCERLIENRKKGQKLGLKEIDKYLRDPANDVKDAEHIRSIFRFLLHYEQLEKVEGDTEAIDMRRAIKNREVIYFSCPTISEGVTSRQIAGLGLYNAIHAAMTLAEENDSSTDERPLPHCHIICDEFQEIAGSSFAALLAQSRKFGISLYLANQTTEQLITRDLDLGASVRDNTNTKMYFTVTGKRDIDELLTFSKERRDHLHNQQEEGSFFTHGMGAEGRGSDSEFITTVLQKNQILETSATDGEFFVLVDDGKGHREPRRIFRDHVMEASNYRKLKSMQIDPTGYEQEQIPKESTAPSWNEQHLSDKKSKEHQARIKQLASLLAEIQREEEVQL